MGKKKQYCSLPSDTETRKKLHEIAEKERRTSSLQLEVLIEREHKKIFP